MLISISGPTAPIKRRGWRRRFKPADLTPELTASGVRYTVKIEAGDGLTENVIPHTICYGSTAEFCGRLVR
jgi:hypothetical protein